MSLRDRLRKRHGDGDGTGDGDGGAQGGDDVSGDGGDEAAGSSALRRNDAGPEVPPASSRSRGASGPPRNDVTDFDPHSDGDYHCVERGLYLRFARPVVMESDSAHPDEHPEPARGEFTQSGRFVVQRRFARPVVYTVLDVRARSLTVRRTDTAASGDAGTEELQFTFEPDDADRE